MQIQKQVMLVKVYQKGGARYLDGWTLFSLGFGNRVTGGKDELYEFTQQQIDEMLNNYMRRDPHIELRQEVIPLAKEEEEPLMSLDELARMLDELSDNNKVNDPNKKGM